MLWGQQWSKWWSLRTAMWRDWGRDLWVRLCQCKDKREASSDLCFGATRETGLLLQETHPIYLGPKSYSCYKTRQLDCNQNWQSMTLGDLEGQRLQSIIMACSSLQSSTTWGTVLRERQRSLSALIWRMSLELGRTDLIWRPSLSLDAWFISSRTLGTVSC